MCKYSWVSFNGPDSDTRISRFEHLAQGTSRHPKINVIGKAQKKTSRSDILHPRQGTSSFFYLWRKMLDTYFFSAPRPHTSAFKGLCTAFDLKQNPDKTPNLVAALCFYPFQTPLIVWLLGQDWTEGSLPLCLEWSFLYSTSTTLTFLEEMMVQKVLGAEPRRVRYYSNHYTGGRLFIASSVWSHELYFLGSRVALH